MWVRSQQGHVVEAKRGGDLQQGLPSSNEGAAQDFDIGLVAYHQMPQRFNSTRLGIAFTTE